MIEKSRGSNPSRRVVPLSATGDNGTLK